MTGFRKKGAREGDQAWALFGGWLEEGDGRENLVGCSWLPFGKSVKHVLWLLSGSRDYLCLEVCPAPTCTR